ncbi:MAG: glutamate dehydrogenase [Motiliproteus sp.]|jgi:glutamate dehydrogenase
MKSYTDVKQTAIEQVKQRLTAHMPRFQAEQASRLAEQYYAQSIALEIAADPHEDLYGALLCLWHSIQTREPHRPLVQVYNPNIEDHGWHTTHSVIEILTDDMPFLVTSVCMELSRRDLKIHKMTHPVLQIHRSQTGKLLEILEPDQQHPDARGEALMRIEIDQQTDSDALQHLVEAIKQILSDISCAVADWPEMAQTLAQVIDTCRKTSLPVPATELEESLEFLSWVGQDNFLFLGYRHYQLDHTAERTLLHIVPGSGLGTFRDVTTKTRTAAPLSERLTRLALAPQLLVLTKSTSRSTVQRPAHLDYLGIKEFDAVGQVIGEWRFFGLYSSQAYSAPIADVPLLRQKIATIWQDSGLTPASHSGKALRHIINHYPRDEMLQASPEQLKNSVFGILECQERRRLRVFLRPDSYGRFITALVYVPRDHYNTELRLKMQEILQDEFDGHSIEFNVQLSDHVLAQVQFTVHSHSVLEYNGDPLQIEARMIAAMLSWNDNLHQTLIEQLGEAQGNRLMGIYKTAFPAAYREEVSPHGAVADMLRLDALGDSHLLTSYLYRPLADFDSLHFRVLGQGPLVALSDVLPILEHMGVKVLGASPYALKPQDARGCWILDFKIDHQRGVDPEDRQLREQFQETFVRCYQGDIESDGFNALVIAAGIGWRQVILLRALCKYLLQLRLPFSQTYMQQTLATNATITRLLVAWFEQRFDPTREVDRQARTEALTAQIETALDEVENLDQDRILRHFLSLLQAMLRTNYFQPDAEDQHKAYLSFKLRPELIPAAPQPKPMFEIFVYAPWVEGVHMRGGKVARGGLRWSDRKEDFRTEVLGLVKAQLVKNAVIVPVGAKGGFVPKQLSSEAGRDAIQAEVIHSYKTFICGLLDLTDNLVDGVLTPPPLVVRHDDDDPYLVVAADKGTATFSDIANEISAAYGFWLGDAFASGGSQGYDHKKMGITARGGWESVKRLFRERGLDTQSSDFSVVGIGDMGGDVFGNGMLLSEHIQLVAAFNHQHIFIDPTPVAGTSYSERRRLFELPRSSWSDYDSSLISKGGGIFERRAKSIPLSIQARKALGINATALPPSELIQAILRAPVDLFWNGGIGTYVKARKETHEQVGDRANDSLRINASELQAAVVGEGGNLGLTQMARIEFSRRGQLINTDAIDNSGGVDSSDHEVNIKILIDAVVNNGDLTLKHRNQLLASMTDEVAQLVLRHNRLQSHILSLCVHQAPRLLKDHRHLVNTLELEGRLKRQLENLPDDAGFKALAKKGQGLTRPEIAVLLSYSKLRLFDLLIQEQAAADPVLAQVLPEYFPKPLRTRFATELAQHPLREEIICTQLTNLVGNRMGSTFCHYVQQETHCSMLDIIRAWSIAKQVLGVEVLWSELDALGFGIDDALQRDLYIEVQDLLEKTTLWLLCNHPGALQIEPLIGRYQSGMDTLKTNLPKLLDSSSQQLRQTRLDRYQEQGLNDGLAQTLVALRYLYQGFDVIRVAQQQQQPAVLAAQAYYALDALLQLPWLRQQVSQLPETDLWQRKARAALANELDKLLAAATGRLLADTQADAELEVRLQQWQRLNEITLNRCQKTLLEIRSATELNLAMLSVAVREISSLTY